MIQFNTLQFQNSYVDLPSKFYTLISPTPVKQPKLIIFNQELAKVLDMDLPFDDSEMLGNFFSGNRLPEGLNPIAQAYAGHQFGHFSILGDGRAHLMAS